MKDRVEKMEAVIAEANEFMTTETKIWRAKQIAEPASRRLGRKIENSYVSKVLKKCCGLRYKRVKKISFTANSAENLIKRQMYSKIMLNLLGTDKHVINIDESWFNETDFRRMLYKRRGVNNSVRQKTVSPRIACIVAIDNYGNSYISLTQVNTDEDVFCLYLDKLVARLNIDRLAGRATVF